MRSASSIYKMLRTYVNMGSGTAYYQVRILLGNTVYEMDKIVSCTLSSSLTGNKSGIVVGQACATECDLILLEKSQNWSRMGKFTVQVRITSGESSSEWISLGDYYTDTRSEDEYGRLVITGYDGMLLTEQYWTDKIDEEDLPASFPITCKAWCDLVEDAGLVTFDSRTTIDDTVAMIGLNTGSTIRDVLKTIAAAHGCNWCVTDTGELRMIPYASMNSSMSAKAGLAIAGIAIVGSDEIEIDEGAEYTFLGMAVSSFAKGTPLPAVTGASLQTESGVTATAGSPYGYVVLGDCEFSTTTGVAELCLNNTQGFVYKPFEANDAILDPLAELGDLVVINGQGYQLMNIDWTINGKPTAHIYAPYEEEIDHEYTIPSDSAKTYRKTLAATDEKLRGYPTNAEVSSLIQQSADEISLSVSSTYVTISDYEDAIDNLQRQIEGSVTSYSGGAVPTLSNYPANEWLTDLDKKQHVGSLYLVTSDQGSPQAGQYYRFEQNGAVFQWVLVEDSALATALANAAAAQAAADQALSDAAEARQAAEDAQGTADQARLEAEAKAAEAQAAAILQAALDATEKVAAALEEAKLYSHEELEDFISGEYAEDLESVKEQLDRKIQTYYQTRDPAQMWTEEEYADHIGDLWYSMGDQLYYRWNGEEWEEMTANPPQAVFDTIDGKVACFVEQPVPPYSVGDIWTQGATGDILRCNTARESWQSFHEEDWELASKYTDDSSLRYFINNEFKEMIEAIKTQVDGKAETFYQATDPSLDGNVNKWDGVVGRIICGVGIVGSSLEIHTGDMWYRTTDDKTFRWDGTQWVEQQISREVFDTIDGKANIFISQPVPPYKAADLWVQGETGDIFRCKAGVDKAAGQSYDANDWEFASKYTDDTVANEVNSDLQAYKETVTSEFAVRDEAIEARVTRTGGQNTSFGWQMTDTYHRWYANNVKVAEIKQSGLYVEGEIKATSGYIGNGSNGFTIDATSLYNGMTSLSDTTHDGVYVGTDGIALGKGKFKVTSTGAVTASDLAITGGSIKLGGTDANPVFHVTSAGAVTASNMSILGGSITIRDNSNNIIFQASSSGVTVNGNGTFTGTVYARNIQVGQNEGYITGTQIGSGEVDTSNLALSAVTNDILDSNSVSNSKLQLQAVDAGNVVQNCLTDTQMAINSLTTDALSLGIGESLGLADLFGMATTRGSATYPAYFCATSITALSSMYANEFYIELGQDNQLGLKTHYHTVTVNQDGTVQFGQPTNTQPSPFNVADTKKYKDDVAAITVTSLDIEYTYDDEMHIYRLIGKAKNQAGTVVYQSTAGQWNTDRSAYVDGKADGADEVTVTTITRTYPDGESSYPYYDSPTLGKIIEFKAIATMSNSHSGTEILTVPATAAYNAGYSDGEDDGADSVTITSITRTYPDGESSYPYYDSATLGKVIEFKAIASMSNGHSGTQVLTVPATSAYNAGYEAGSQGGSGSVTIESVGRDTSQSTTYDSSTKLYTIPIIATASNGATGTGTVQQSGAAAYMGGYADGTQYGKDQVTVTSLGLDEDQSVTYNSSGSIYTVPIKAVLSNSEENPTTETATIQISGGEAYAAGAQQVSVRSIVLNENWSYSATGYRYLADSISYEFSVVATLSNNRRFTQTRIIAANAAYDAGEASVSVTGMQYYTVSGEDTVTYNSSDHTLSASVQATLTNGNTSGSIRTVTIPAILAYNAGTTDGANSVSTTAIQYYTVSGEDTVSYNASTKILSASVQATLSNGNTNGSIRTVNIPATLAYNAGYTDGNSIVSVTAMQYYTVSGEDTVTYNSTNKTLSASVQATLSNGNTSGSIRTVTIPAALAYNAGKQDGITEGSSGVIVRTVGTVAATSSNYNTYDKAIAPSAASLYTSGSYSYGLARITLSNNTESILQFRVPASSGSSVSSITVTREHDPRNYSTIRECMADWDLSETSPPHVYVKVKLQAYSGSTPIGSVYDGRVCVDDIADFFATEQSTILATTSTSANNNYDIEVDTTGYTNAFFKVGSYQYVRFQLQNEEGDNLDIVRVKMPSTDTAITEVFALTSNSSTYTDYDWQASFAASSMYTPSGSSTQYARVQINLNNGTNKKIRVAVPVSGGASGTITIDRLATSSSVNPYYGTLPYYAYINNKHYVQVKATCAGASDRTQYIDINDIVNYAYEQGGGGGATTPITLRCTNKTSGSGIAKTWTFQITSTADYPFVAGTSYTFYY